MSRSGAGAPSRQGCEPRPPYAAKLALAGVEPLIVPAEVEAVRREGYLFLINHGDAEAVVPASGHDLLDGSDHAGEVAIPAGGVRVLRG